MKKEKKISRSLRLGESLNKAVNLVSLNSGLCFTDIVELGIIEFLSSMKTDLIFEGVDLRNHAKLLKFDKLRQIQKYERRQLMSRHLFVDNLKRNILLYLAKKKGKKNILELLDTTIKEAKYYTNNEDLLKEIEFFKNEVKNGRLLEMKQMIETEIDSLEFQVVQKLRNE